MLILGGECEHNPELSFSLIVLMHFMVFKICLSNLNSIQIIISLTHFLHFTSNSYKSREDFCVDVRQIFDNCEMFNEDDSPVGKAGHGMRKFFELRWAELTDKHS